MQTTTVSSTGVGQDADAAGRRASARCTVQLIGTLTFNGVLLLAGVRLTGFAWQDVCLLVLPPAMAGAGAVLTFFALNHMALRSEVTDADSPQGHAEPRTWVKAARAC
jgi:hypothetical protein